MTALYCGPPEGFILDELEIGKRAATYLGNEQEGFGAWVDAKIFEINLSPVALQSDWTRNPHTDVAPKLRVKPVEVFIPAQRQPHKDLVEDVIAG